MGNDPDQGTMISGRRVAVSIVLAALGIAGCSTPHAASSSTTSQPSPTTTTLQPVSATTSAPPTTSSSETTTSSTSAVSPPQNLIATASDKGALVDAFIAFTHDPASEIAGTESGSVYYAYLPSTATYWAFSRFVPSPSASQKTLVSLQDGGNIGIFSKQADGDWMMLSIGGEPFCPTRTAIPASIQALWGFKDPPECS
jgi:hypothetical protein